MSGERKEPIRDHFSLLLSSTMSDATHDSAHDDDGAPGPPISVPDSGDTGEGGKIKMIVQLVKKCLGVKDIAAMCANSTSSPCSPLMLKEHVETGDFLSLLLYLSLYPTWNTGTTSIDRMCLLRTSQVLSAQLGVFGIDTRC